MQSVLSHQALAGAQAAGKGAGLRAGSSAAFRPPAKSAGQPGKSSLSHKARVWAAAAVAEAPPAPVFTAPPSINSDSDVRSVNDVGLQFKFLVPASVVGAILGRGGATVAAIKRESGAYVQFTRPGTATNSRRERMMILAVDRPQQLPRAIAMVLEAVAVEGALDKLRTKAFAPDKLFIQQLIPATCAGKVMGPGGEAIKALGERTGCSVVVEGKQANAAFVPFRLVNYLAPGAGEVAAAVVEVAELICQDDKYEAGIRELTSVCFRIIEVPERRVGALLGPSGAHIKSLQEVLRCKMGVADNSTKPGSRFVSIWGAPLNVKVAVDVVMLAVGLLQQQVAADGASMPGTPRTAAFAGSLAPSVNGDYE